MRLKTVSVVAVLTVVMTAPVAWCQEDTAKVGYLRPTTKKIDMTIPWLNWVEEDVPVHGYLGVDDFFNVREANPNIGAKQWEFEIGMIWQTFEDGTNRDDDFGLGASIKYGYTDDFNIEFEFQPVNFGDGSDIDGLDGGDDGNGETALKAFWQIAPEQDIWPAIALSGTMRIPSGEGSSNLDGTLTMMLTKTVYSGVRSHLQGFVMTANGSRGDFDHDAFGGRENFQWGVGAGLDFMINDQNLFLINYSHKTSDFEDADEQDVLEAGWVYDLADNQQLMLGVNGNINPERGDAHWTGKVQYALSW